MELLTEAPTEVRFSTPDWIVFVTLLVVSMGIGVVSAYKGRKKESANDYLVGGRSISPFAVALSLLGGVMSAIAILGFASESYFYGLQFSAAGVGILLGGLIVYYIILPVLYNLQLVSMCQYLQIRFKSTWLRQITSVCQIVSMVLLMAIILYAPALALSTVTSLPSWASVIIMGSICTIYTTIGGVRGVVYTDVLQTTVMFVGVVVVIVMGSVKMGGGSNVWAIAVKGERTQIFELNPDPFIRHTLWSTVVLGVYLGVFFFGINQASHQRFSSVSTLTVAKRLCVVAVLGCVCLLALCTAAGIVAYAVYSGCDPLVVGAIQKPDQILPYLVAHTLGHLRGVPGVFVAAVYGGVLSSVSSCGNSLACMVWDDFLSQRPYFKKMSDKKATSTLKMLSFWFGVVGVGLGVGAGQLGGVLQVANSVVGAVNGPLIGLYLTGILTPWVNAKGGIIGFISSLILNVWFLVGNLLRGKANPPTLPLSTSACPNITTPITPPSITTIVESTSRSIYDISYCYIGPCGIIITIIISSIVSPCVGMLSPWEIEKGAAHPLGTWIHRGVWRVIRGHKSGGGKVTRSNLGSRRSNQGSKRGQGMEVKENSGEVMWSNQGSRRSNQGSKRGQGMEVKENSEGEVTWSNQGSMRGQGHTEVTLSNQGSRRGQGHADNKDNSEDDSARYNERYVETNSV